MDLSGVALADTNGPDRPLSSDRSWRAVRARDPRFDGRFVFAVRSTGIYCRPSCPARRPRRGNVLFFPDPGLAERAGFRACRRCRPAGAAPTAAHRLWVDRLCQRIEAGGPMDLARWADEMGLSPQHLQRTFKRLLGITPRQYAEALRFRSLRARLRKGQPVTHALYEAGFGSSSRLYEQSTRRLGMTPATYRRGGPATGLAYTLASSPLGRLLVASTDRGVAAVKLGEADRRLVAELREEYPAAELRRDDVQLRATVRTILAGLRGRAPSAELPHDVRATAFQWRVWQELLAIPAGATRTYGEVARRLGRPTAARAVARACATNPVALVIPCHRVVPAGGGVGGYRWGEKRKRALLEGEARPR